MLQRLRIGQRTQHITRWETVTAYFKEQGIPSAILSNYCISRSEAEQIGYIIKKTRPRTILEVGTFIGLSTGVIALSRVPESTLICIDPNLPVGDYVDFFTPQVNFSEKLGSLDFVLRMLKHFGQEQQTIVLEGFFSHLSAWSREQIAALGGDPEQASIIGEKVGKYAPYDLAFIDGDHSTDAVYRDLSLLCRYMAQDGIIVLHDVSGYWKEQVCTGIAQFIEDHDDFSLKIDKNLGFLSRDVEKSWFVRQIEEVPIMYRLRRKVASLISK
jgi:predicted O-methyltransferase YrrM